MQVEQIVTEADYIEALVEIGRLIAFEAGPGTPDGNRLEALTCRAAEYETECSLLDLADAEAR